MSNQFKFISRHCILWTLRFHPTLDMALISENFLLRDVKCNLRFVISGPYGAQLFWESNVILNPALEITVIAIPKDITYNLNFDSLIKRTTFSEKRKVIWKKHSLHHLETSLTFVVNTHERCVLKELQPEDISRNNVPSENRNPSFLENMAHFQAFSRDFEKLLDGSSSFDVEIIFCDEFKIKAHKIVLETRSPVFSAMLKSNMVEGNTCVINIEDIRSSIFESFLRYLYTGMLPELCIETAKELYNVGDMYAVEEIKKACSEFLCNNLSESNACETLVLADLHSDEKFREKVISYIVEKKIPQHYKQWVDFCNLHSSLANEVLNTFIKRHC